MPPQHQTKNSLFLAPAENPQYAPGLIIRFSPLPGKILPRSEEMHFRLQVMSNSSFTNFKFENMNTHFLIILITITFWGAPVGAQTFVNLEDNDSDFDQNDTEITGNCLLIKLKHEKKYF